MLSKFTRKFREKFRKYAFIGGWGGAEPPKLAKLFKKLVEKSMETYKILKVFYF